MKSLILAAGLGTRLRPLTDDHPKALIEVDGKTLLQHAIERVKTCGANEIIINTHHFSDKVKKFVSDYRDSEISLTVSDESDLLLDTGGAIKKAEWFLKSDQSFMVYNADILSGFDLNELVECHNKNNAGATLAVSDRESSRYLLFNEDNMLCAWRNEKTGEERISRKSMSLKRFAFSGIYMLSPEIFNFMPEEKIFSIIDVFLEAAKSGVVKAFPHNSKEILDVGKPEALEKANNLLHQWRKK